MNGTSVLRYTSWYNHMNGTPVVRYLWCNHINGTPEMMYLWYNHMNGTPLLW